VLFIVEYCTQPLRIATPRTRLHGGAGVAPFSRSRCCDAAMRRFVQALAGFADFPGLPADIGAALRAQPDRYNIAIHGQAAIVYVAHDVWHVAPMAWGLVPKWEPEPTTRYSTQTARLERAPTSRLFRRAWAQRRCVLPLNGYYKWQRETKPYWPWFIQPVDGQPLYAAALWERWEGDAGVSDSFAVLTFPNPAIPAPLTADGPVFLPPAQLFEWMAGDPKKAARLAARAAQPRLETYPVARRVANRTLDDYTLLEPVEPGAETGVDGDAIEEEADSDD
jgi:putative SOS response-associated peptidase YedK